MQRPWWRGVLAGLRGSRESSVAGGGGEQEREGHEREQGEIMQGLAGCCGSCLNEMQSWRVWRKEDMPSRATLTLCGYQPTMGRGGNRESGEEATAMVQVGDKGGLNQLGVVEVLD